MAILIDMEQRHQDRVEEMEDREYMSERENLKRQHELRILRKKLQYTTRWRAVVQIIRAIAAIIPKCLAVVGIVVLQTCNRPIPPALDKVMEW